MPDLTLALVSFALCAVGAGLTSSIEVALTGLPEVRIRHAVDEDLFGAQGLAAWLKSPANVMATLQLDRVAFLVGAGLSMSYLAAATPSDLVPPWAALGLAMVVLGPALWIPRALAKRYALTWARHTIGPLRVWTAFHLPVVWPLIRVGRFVSGFFGGTETSFWSPDELTRLSAQARTGSLDDPAEDLIGSIIEFSDTVIREIMVPRTDTVTIPVDGSPEEIQHIVVEGGHSRIPVYEETIDNIVGVLHVKDMFRAALRSGGDLKHPSVSIAKLVRACFYVPEVMKISELLREFQRRKTHMAIVVDEYGGTAGVVTLEDIIEEIVGEIQDEYDVEDKQYRVLPDNKVIADGRVTIYDLEDVLGVTFPEDSGFETLAGFLMFLTGHLPKAGAVIEWESLRFTVKEANERRIAMVEVERRDAVKAAAAS